MSFTLSIKDWLKIGESNESLMLKYGQTGESKYLKVLVDRLADDLYHFMVSQSDQDTAKDICQISWEKVIYSRRSYSDSGSFKSWLFKIARFSLIDEMRRRQRWQMVELEEQADLTPSQLRMIEMSQLNLTFDQALASLPVLQREAFILQQEGFRLREISIITGSEMETVKSRLRYAKLTLKSLMKLELEGGNYE